MRILHFNSNISRNSGVMSVIMNYYSAINKDYVQFDFLYFRESAASYAEEILKWGGRCYTVLSPKNIMRFKAAIRKFADSHVRDYDIVHIHDTIFAKLVYSIFKKAGIKCVIIHSHATRYSDKKISNMRNAVLCHNITKYADSFFACSKAAGKFMFGNEPFYVMNNAIQTSKYSYSNEKRKEIREKLGIDDYFIVGHVGAFVNQKNHDFLIDVFKEIKKIRTCSKLLLAGDGPLFDMIKQKASLLGLDSDIVFLGKRADVNDLYQAMDIFVLPSLFEGLPMVGVEAQCSGLPVVFSTEITREVEINKCLFLDLNRDKQEWATQIINLYENSERSAEDALNKIRLHGFDIKAESNKLIDKYCVLAKG